MFVIMKAGMYVAKSGMACSYTNQLQFARRFRMREAALAECCPGNEVVVSLQNLGF